MKKITVPKFKKSLTFVDDVTMPCLQATMLNSMIPHLAEKYRKKHLEDPEFDIFLRAKNPAAITAWQKSALKRLLEKGELVTAIEQGMKQYKAERDDDYVAYERRAWDDMERHGVLPHLVLSWIVVDDIKRQIILSLHTTADGHLEEHGIKIYLEKNQWRFDPDYLYDYLNEVEEEMQGSQAVDFDVEEKEEETETSKKENFTDAGFLYGTWVFDAETETALRQKDGESAEEIRSWILEFQKCRYEFSAGRMLVWNKYISPSSRPYEYEFFGCLMKGNKLTVKLRDTNDTNDMVAIVWECRKDRLRNVTNGGVFKKLD